MRFYALLLVIPSLLFGGYQPSEFEMAALEGEPSALIDGQVHAITGDLIFEQYDVIIRGASPLYVHRRYISREVENPKLRWNLFYHTRAHFVACPFPTAPRIFIPEPNGVSLQYSPDHAVDYSDKRIDIPASFLPTPGQFLKGRTNTRNDYFGSVYNPEKNRVIWDNESLTLFLSHGGHRLYKKAIVTKDRVPVTIYTFQEERLANGHFMLFRWNSEENSCATVCITNPAKTKTFASYSIEFDKKGVCHIRTSDSRELTYTSAIKKGISYLKSISPADYPDEELIHNKHGRVTCRKFPAGREIQFTYDQQGRVTQLQKADGATYQVSYYSGRTEAIDGEGNKTIYHYNDDYRLTTIERFQGADKLINREVICWQASGQLISRALRDEDNQLLFQKSYVYDEMGNVIEETLSGILTGTTDEIETATIYRKYAKES